MTATFPFRGSGTAATAFALGLFIAPPTISPTNGNSLYRTHLRTTTAQPSSERRNSTKSPLTATYSPILESFDNQLLTDTSERETSAAEKVAGELRRWAGLSANWDGEGASAPNLLSLNAASDFIRLLPATIADAEPMLHANGRAGLYWNDEALYADLEFLGDGHIAYFVQHSEEKHKGILRFNNELVPPVLTALLEVQKFG